MINHYIYIIYKWSTTHRVFKSRRSKMSITVHHVPKCMSCHKVIVVITGRAQLFSYIYVYIYKYIYIYIYVYIYILMMIGWVEWRERFSPNESERCGWKLLYDWLKHENRQYMSKLSIAGGEKLSFLSSRIRLSLSLRFSLRF